MVLHHWRTVKWDGSGVGVRKEEYILTFWYEYAISLTVTGICRLDKLAFAARTCAFRAEGSRTPSNSGSEPNCSTRVTNLALGFKCSVARRVSRRPFHLSSPLKPNYNKWETAYMLLRSLTTDPHESMNADTCVPCSINDIVTVWWGVLMIALRQ